MGQRTALMLRVKTMDLAIRELLTGSPDWREIGLRTGGIDRNAPITLAFEPGLHGAVEVLDRRLRARFPEEPFSIERPPIAPGTTERIPGWVVRIVRDSFLAWETIEEPTGERRVYDPPFHDHRFFPEAGNPSYVRARRFCMIPGCGEVKGEDIGPFVRAD